MAAFWGPVSAARSQLSSHSGRVQSQRCLGGCDAPISPAGGAVMERLGLGVVLPVGLCLNPQASVFPSSLSRPPVTLDHPITI